VVVLEVEVKTDVSHVVVQVVKIEVVVEQEVSVLVTSVLVVVSQVVDVDE